MARNNPDRFKTAPITQPQIQNENLFSFVTPTDFVALPSGGKFYPEDHPLHRQEVVEIRFMTAKEEDILTSQALLIKGLALDRLIDSVLVEKSIDTESLLLGDKNALLVACRVTGYGSEYRTDVTCPACENIDVYAFDLGELQFAGAPDTAENATLTDNGTYIIDGLTQTGATVEVRFLTGRDEKELNHKLESNKKHNLGLPPLLEQMKIYIVAVNGHTSDAYINSFLQSAPAMDARHLRKVYASLIPNVDLTQQYVCDACLHEAPLEVPLTADFFWPQ